MQLIDDIISELALGKAADTYIGGVFMRGVSGGERKRCNVGVELLSNPSLIFLDEPTSGEGTKYRCSGWGATRAGRRAQLACLEAAAQSARATDSKRAARSLLESLPRWRRAGCLPGAKRHGGFVDTGWQRAHGVCRDRLLGCVCVSVGVCV